MTDLTVPDPAVSPEIEARVKQLLDDCDVTTDLDQVSEIVATAVRMGLDDTDRLNLKITNAAVAEMRNAFRIFEPFTHVPKVTIFGSARTGADEPIYAQTHEAAAALADAGWMVVTGAGPGIMQAAMEGAGVDRSIGVSIRLPFETRPNDVIHGDPKHVSMKYFFTRKLMLVKESMAFLSVPGGFGTLDETFELLTLQQTGKAEPTPIVLLDSPGRTFWSGLNRFFEDELVTAGVVSPDDLDRVLITDSVEAAVAEITRFWHNYHSLRWVGQRLVLRLRHDPTDDEIESLNDRFADLLSRGSIERTGPLGPERTGQDWIELPRVVLTLNQWKVGSLHKLIRALNELPSANP